MPYIAREDGERFVIPSYRDVVTAKQSAALQKEIVSLSQSYGEYATLQRKAKLQFEVAFSPDLGYLLGETVWYRFNRPNDMIYCEAIPNSTEAILVIVKNGSVYLDGSFQLDNIPEELVIFLTQQNDFEIYVHGDVPISETAAEGKFSFDEGSVKSFTVLEEPVFNSLPLVKAYRFQPVDAALKSQGIGGPPVAAIVGVLVGLVIAWFAYSYVSETINKKPEELPMEKNPYEAYVNNLASPAPDELIQAFLDQLHLLNQAPGWIPLKMEMKGSNIKASMGTQSGVLSTLLGWCNEHNLSFIVNNKGLEISSKVKITSRKKPKIIYPVKDVMVILLDRIMTVYPGYKNVKVRSSRSKGPFSTNRVTVQARGVSPQLIAALGQQLQGLPVILSKVSFGIKSGQLNGSIEIDVLGN